MKSKLITTMMTALFLTFAVMAPPLLSVPTVSASTLKVTWWEWCSDVMPPPPFDPFPDNALLMAGRFEGDISFDYWIWSTPQTATVGHNLKPEPSTTFHWHQNFLWVFDKDGKVWVTGWYDGVWPQGEREEVLSGSVMCEGRITGASPDKTNWIGCKVSAKGITIWYPDPLPNGVSPAWGEWGVTTWGYAEGTGSISGSLNK